MARRHPLRNRIPARHSRRNRPSGAARIAARRGFTRLRVDGQTLALDGPDPALPSDAARRRRRRSPGSRQRPPRPPRRLDRDGLRAKVWADAGSSHSESRALTFAAGGAATAEPTTSSRSPPSSAITARSAPVRSAKDPAAPWSSTWAGSFPTRRSRSARVRSPPGRSRLFAVTSMNCWPSPPSSTFRSTSPSKVLMPAQVEQLVEGVSGNGFRRPPRLLSRPRGPHAPAPEPVVLEPLQASRGLPGLSRGTPQARGAGRQDRGPQHRRALGDDHPRFEGFFRRSE